MTLLAVSVILSSVVLIVLGWFAYAFGLRLSFQQQELFDRLDEVDDEIIDLEQSAAQAEMPVPIAKRERLAAGTPAPAFDLPDLDGKRVSLEQFRGRRVLLIFWLPTCGFCDAMAPDLAKLAYDGRNGLPIPLVVTSGGVDANRELFVKHKVKTPPMLLQEAMEVQDAYKARPTPTGYLVDETGIIVSDYAMGAAQLLRLARDPESGKRKAPDTAVAGAAGADGTHGANT